MDADPFAGFPEALERLVAVAQRRAPRNDAAMASHIAEIAVEHFESHLETLEKKAWSRRRDIEDELGAALSSPLRSLDSMVGIVESVNLLLRNNSLVAGRPPDIVRYATAMLLSRATSVANEILALARAGFPVGARARWRTLYELDVVAAVLYRGNRGTAARYVNHRWVIVAQRHGEFFPDEQSWELAAPEVNRMAQMFITRYGPAYSTTYGWAAELTRRRLGVEKPQWRHLVRLADLDGHERHVAYANRAVHADAIGGLLTVDATSSLFHSGARHAGVPGACLATVRVLGEILDSVIRTWGSYGASDASVVLALCDELSLILQRGCVETVAYEPDLDQPDPPAHDE